MSAKRPRQKFIWAALIVAVIALSFSVYSLARAVQMLGLANPLPTEPAISSTAPPATEPSSTAASGTTVVAGTTAATAPSAETIAARKALLLECEGLLAGHFYDEAIEKLENCGPLQSGETDALLAEAVRMKDELVLYEGQLYHVFFHSLVIDPKKAFDGDGMSNYYNMYMTTVSEFQKMLPLLLEGGFILYDINELVEFVDGSAVRKPVYLPPGKKPLVLSIDDVNYYEYMRLDGFASRLDVDEYGNVVTIVKDSSRNDVVTYDGDVVPILDAFVREHPEFSWRGHKGIVAITGYQGAFGYRITDLELYSADEGAWMLEKTQEVASALRANGWLIANHSYTHNQYWNHKMITDSELAYDTGRWLNEIAPYVGGSNIFIAPFGSYFDQNHFVFRYLVDNGFNIYCPVGSDMTTTWQNDNMVQFRLNLDGLTMIRYPERISEHFFDPALVLDPARPPLK